MLHQVPSVPDSFRETAEQLRCHCQRHTTHHTARKTLKSELAQVALPSNSSQMDESNELIGLSRR
jgi:hypothetical protein